MARETVKERIQWYLQNDGVDFWLRKHFKSDRRWIEESQVKDACDKALKALEKLDSVLDKHGYFVEAEEISDVV